MTTDMEKRTAAARFAADWKDRGDEKTGDKPVLDCPTPKGLWR